MVTNHIIKFQNATMCWQMFAFIRCVISCWNKYVAVPYKLPCDFLCFILPKFPGSQKSGFCFPLKRMVIRSIHVHCNQQFTWKIAIKEWWSEHTSLLSYENESHINRIDKYSKQRVWTERNGMNTLAWNGYNIKLTV